MTVWVRLGTVVSLALAAATLPVSARSLSVATRGPVGDSNQPPGSQSSESPPSQAPAPELPTAPAGLGETGGNLPCLPCDDSSPPPVAPEAKLPILVLRITPNGDVWAAGSTRTLDGSAGSALMAALLSSDLWHVPVVDNGSIAVSRTATPCPARKAWLICRYPNAPPIRH